MIIARTTFMLATSLLFACLAMSSKAQPGVPDTQPDAESRDDRPTRQELLNRMYSERKLLVVFGIDNSAGLEEMRAAIENSSWGRWRTNLVVQHADETTRSDLNNSAVLLIGNPSTNSFLADIPASIPLSFGRSHFSFSGKDYTDSQDVISLLYPNPHNPRYPLFILGGFDEESLKSALSDRLRNLDYQVLRGQQRLRVGNFSQESGQQWQYDPDLDEDFEEDAVLVGSTKHFRFYAHNSSPDHSTLSEIILKREEIVDRVLQHADKRDLSIPPYTYVLYPSLEEKAIVTNSMDFAHVDYRQRTIHVAIEQGIRGDMFNKEALLLTHSLFGNTPFLAFEDGLSILLSEEWFDSTYDRWMARIAHGHFALPAADLLDNAIYRQSSALLREPMAAAFVGCMIDEWGKDNFLSHYSEWQPTSGELAVIEQVWNNCLSRYRTDFVPPVRTRKQNLHPPFQKGFNFAHEGYGIVDGYGSRSADDALRKLFSMGGNAISIIPYTGMRNPFQPSPFRFSNSANDENDGAVAHAARYAQEMDFTVMLKPQIWVRGSWPGDVDMQTEEDWDLFFEYYERWISHYAFLAELFEIDILCIGTELTHATMKHEDRWIDLASRLRSIYSGQLIYASNWGEEFESLRFWNAFDYIGLNSYYPLSEKENATEEELRKGARAVIKRINSVQKRFNKPLLLTEIGFPSSEKPWVLPFDEKRQAPPNADHQALCYKVMIETLEGENWLSGIYWWKWPSHLERGGAESRDRFTPNGKPAEDVISEWYRGL